MFSLFMLMWSAVAAPVADGVSWTDDLTDGVGLDLSASSGVLLAGGSARANAQQATLVTQCMERALPPGATAGSWSFLDIETDRFTDVSSAMVTVTDCDTNTVVASGPLTGGCDGIDLSAVDAARISLSISITHQGAAGPFATIDRISAHGLTDGIVAFEMHPNTQATDAGSVITLSTSLGANGATLIEPEVVIDLDEMNLNPLYVSDGWDPDVGVTRPVEFMGASLGLASEAPSVPALGETTGAITWGLLDLPGGSVGDLTLDLTIPTGTVDQRTVSGVASLHWGATSTCDDTLDARRTERADTVLEPITVSSVIDQDPFYWTAFAAVRPDEAIYSTWIQDSAAAGLVNASDLEDVILTYDPGTSDCPPIYTGVGVVWPTGHPANFSDYEVLSEPASGTPWTTPVVVRLPRVQAASSRPSVYVYYSGPALGTCPDRSVLRIEGEYEVTAPPFRDAEPMQHTFYEEHQLCHVGVAYYAYRTMNGDEFPRDYDSNASNAQDSYLGGFFLNEFGDAIFSIGPGETYGQWIPYTGPSGSPTRTIDASFFLGDLPTWTTFRGVLKTNFTDPLEVYKDCAGTALAPDDPGFSAATPTASGWNLVDSAWSAPFSDPPSPTNPRGIIPGGCRVLMHRSPATAPINRQFVVSSVLQACDAAMESQGLCTMPNLGDEVQVWGATRNSYTWDGGQMIACGSGTSVANTWFESTSFPRVFAELGSSQVPGGGVIDVVLRPHNENMASAPALSLWSVDLFEARDVVDFSRITGEVVLPTNARVPGDGDLSRIVFHPPVEADCLAAAPGSVDCLGWWEVPDDLQLPNYWGVGDASTKGRQQSQATYQFELHAPLLPSAPAGETHDLLATARAFSRLSASCTTDAQCGPGARCATEEGVCWTIDDLGASNKATRWDCTDICEQTLPVTVLEVPNMAARKTGPATWPSGWLNYLLRVRNDGNAPQAGWYVVDRLPRAARNGGDLTPTYGHVLVDAVQADVIVDYSVDANCHQAPAIETIAGWTDMPLVGSGRVDYPSITAAALPPSAQCVRVRRSASGPALPPRSLRRVLVEAQIPSGTADGALLANVAYVGASTEMGGGRVPPTVTEIVLTEVSDNLVLDVELSATPSPTEAGVVVWELSYRNNSGTDATDGADLVVCLPDPVSLTDVALPLGASCAEVDCAVGPATGSCPGGELAVHIDQLLAADGADGGGDEGVIVLTGTVDLATPSGAPVTVSGTLVPVAPGTAGYGEATIALGQVGIRKDLVLDPDRGLTPPTALDGDGVTYIIVGTNDGPVASYLRVVDAVPAGVTPVPGTLRLDGATASDALIAGGILDVTSPNPILPRATFEVSFEATIDTGGLGGAVDNIVLVQACATPDDPLSCAVTVPSAPATFLVQVCGNGTVEPVETCDDGGTVAYDGCSPGCEIEPDTDGDGWVDPYETEVTGTDPTLSDTDGDGISDADEPDLQLNPLDADSDEDGLSDGEELDIGTDPTVWDTDEDGLSDGVEEGVFEPIPPGITDGGVGFDGSGNDFVADADPDTTTDPLLVDTDGDTIPDGIEDLDQDGAFAGDQTGLEDDETDPDNPDTDGDGLRDDDEGGPGSDQDEDGDGTIDALDSCWGDHTQGDADEDGICDDLDACEGFDDSLDADGDGAPDACDACEGFDDTVDTDGDGVPNGCESCDGADDSLDADGDSVPDDCDVCPNGDDTLDDDGDGTPDDCDVCPGEDDGQDRDGDDIPDACDACADSPTGDSDGDEACDDVDICLGFDDRLDADGDGVPDGCDLCEGVDATLDSDGDGVCDDSDLCLGSDDSLDADGDGTPDGCDPCPDIVESDVDSDGDGTPDDCDACPDDRADDSDGDGVCDGEDLCEGSDDTADADGDGVPDGCDECEGDDATGDYDDDGICDDLDPEDTGEPVDTDVEIVDDGTKYYTGGCGCSGSGGSGWLVLLPTLLLLRRRRSLRTPAPSRR